jgi:hypothetical protein
MPPPDVYDPSTHTPAGQGTGNGELDGGEDVAASPGWYLLRTELAYAPGGSMTRGERFVAFLDAVAGDDASRSTLIEIPESRAIAFELRRSPPEREPGTVSPELFGLEALPVAIVVRTR